MGEACRVGLPGGIARVLILVGILGTATTGLAAPRGPTVAVMPFRDLSAGGATVGNHVGEAIRETVTTDLRQLGSLRVVERGSLDKVLAEQGLQGGHKDLDVQAVVKLGKIVGASLIVIGAYQKLTPQIRLTARFVKVETSEIVGTAKVDGTTREFLRLQDRITAALLRSAGFPVHAKKLEDDAPGRPELVDLKTLELYGQAVTATSDEARRQYLRAAVATDQGFTYAARDLAVLEEQLKRLQAEAQPIQDRELAELRAQLRQSPDRAKAGPLMLQILSKLLAQHRWHTLVREARTYLEQLPVAAEVSSEIGAIALMLVQYDNSLKHYDAALRDGEWWLKRAPAAPHATSLQALMQQIIERKRSLEENRLKVENELAEKGRPERWDLCAVGDISRNAEQYEAALRFYETCGQLGQKPWIDLYPLILLVTQYGGQWSALRKYLAQWEQASPRAAQQWRTQYIGWFPEDE